MAALQHGVAEALTPAFWVQWLIIIGAWADAQSFLVPALFPLLPVGGKIVVDLSLPAFAITTVD